MLSSKSFRPQSPPKGRIFAVTLQNDDGCIGTFTISKISEYGKAFEEVKVPCLAP